MSIDLEHWWCSEFLWKYLPENPQRPTIEATDGLLRLLKKSDTRATSFVPGSVAEKYPDHIKSIHEGGHEICSHSYSHTPINKLTESEFEDELKASTQLLKSITHEQPRGFRAPRFPVSQSTSRVFELLEKYGYSYDSSIYPVNTMLYGVPKAPLMPYKPVRAE